MWSGPRNLSTAMMRSFGARADMTVWDEPFYGPYLIKSGKDHPGRDEIIALHETNADIIAAQCQAGVKTRFHFQKHMPHHMLEGFPLEWTHKARHFFLIRHPARVIASYGKNKPDMDMRDIGFADQVRFYEKLSAETGRRPPIIDSFDILSQPKKALRALCKAIHIDFDEAMLSWAPGPRPEDGVWAKYWYKSVINSTGFKASPATRPVISGAHAALYAQSLPLYEQLKARKLKIDL